MKFEVDLKSDEKACGNVENKPDKDVVDALIVRLKQVEREYKESSPHNNEYLMQRFNYYIKDYVQKLEQEKEKHLEYIRLKELIYRLDPSTPIFDESNEDEDEG